MSDKDIKKRLNDKTKQKGIVPYSYTQGMKNRLFFAYKHAFWVILTYFSFPTT